jgi:hypothetical protein
LYPLIVFFGLVHVAITFAMDIFVDGGVFLMIASTVVPERTRRPFSVRVSSELHRFIVIEYCATCQDKQ